MDARRLGVILIGVGSVLMAIGAVGAILMLAGGGRGTAVVTPTSSPSPTATVASGAPSERPTDPPTQPPTEPPTAEPTEPPTAERTEPPESPTPEASPSPDREEQMRTFVGELAEAIREGDEAFLFDRLHPAVIARYGEPTCRTYTAGIQDETREFTPISIAGPDAWDYVTDDQPTTIEETWTVTVDQVEDGQESRRDIHLALGDDDEPAWFTDCGAPLA